MFTTGQSDWTGYREEFSGPKLCCVRVPDFNSAFAAVNAPGLSHGFGCFTCDGDVARTFARIQAGMGRIYIAIQYPWRHGVGNCERSIFGECMPTAKRVRFYTRQKPVVQRWPERTARGADFAMPTLR